MERSKERRGRNKGNTEEVRTQLLGKKKDLTEKEMKKRRKEHG